MNVITLYWLCSFANLTWNIILRHESNGRDFMLRIIKQKSWQKGNSNKHTWLTWINWRNNRVKWRITTLWFDYILWHIFKAVAWIFEWFLKTFVKNEIDVKMALRVGYYLWNGVLWLEQLEFGVEEGRKWKLQWNSFLGDIIFKSVVPLLIWFH